MCALGALEPSSSSGMEYVPVGTQYVCVLFVVLYCYFTCREIRDPERALSPLSVFSLLRQSFWPSPEARHLAVARQGGLLVCAHSVAPSPQYVSPHDDPSPHPNQPRPSAPGAASLLKACPFTTIPTIADKLCDLGESYTLSELLTLTYHELQVKQAPENAESG